MSETTTPARAVLWLGASSFWPVAGRGKEITASRTEADNKRRSLLGRNHGGTWGAGPGCDRWNASQYIVIDAKTAHIHRTVNIDSGAHIRYFKHIHCAANTAKMATFEGYRFEKETVDRLLEALRELPDVDARDPVMEPAHHADRGIDAEIEFSTGGRSYVLFIEVKKSVYPRDAQQVLWQFDRYVAAGQAERKKQFVPLLAAESISTGAKDLLKRENCGYFDTGGSLFIPARGAYVYIEKPPPKTLQKSVRGLFRGKRSQVLHALLIRHDEWFGVKELAEFAEVSPATASETLSALERFEWLTVKGQGPSKERRLSDPGALLDEWQKQTLAAPRRQTYRRFYVPAGDPDAIARRLGDICERLGLDYTLTERYAAQTYAPFLSSVSRVTCRLALGSRVNELYAELEARPVNEGANLDVIETRSHGEFLFRERVGPLWLASPVQVYLDLLRSGGRGKEMAEHLRHERIRF